MFTNTTNTMNNTLSSVHNESRSRFCSLQRIWGWNRWLHIYLSTTLFCLLSFFCVTGITLNHTDWIDSRGVQQVNQEKIPDQLQQLLMEQKNIPIERIKHFVANQYGLENPRSIDMDLEVGEISLDFPLPAGYAFVTLFVFSGEVEIEHKQGSFWSLLNDLHKGRHTGGGWSVLIDISAAAIFFLSVTGLILLWQRKKQRLNILITLLAGVATPFIIYWGWVPQYAH